MFANEVSPATSHHGDFRFLLNCHCEDNCDSVAVWFELISRILVLALTAGQIGHMKAILFIVPMAMALHMHAGVSSKDDISIASVTAGPLGPPGLPGPIGQPGIDGKLGPTGP